MKARPGDYADALAKRHQVILFCTEITGAVCAGGFKFLSYLASLVRKPGNRDGTIYGSSLTSTKSFKAHHLSELSAAIVTADAESILNAAAAATFSSLAPNST